MSTHRDADDGAGRAESDSRRKDRQFDHVGSAVPRRDAPGKLTGETVYTMDMYPENVLHAALVTSDEAHARLVDVNTTAAERLDGVVAVATAVDVPDTRIGEFVYDEPIFAREKVRYVGESIAVVAAETEEIAARATELVEVTYDPLEPVFDLKAAGGTDPPAVVHERLRTYDTSPEGYHVEGCDRERPNLLTTVTAASGDVDAAFDRADLVFEDEYEVKPLQHAAMEPHVAVAQVDAGTATIWTSHQIPHVIRRDVARLFPEFEAEDIVVRTPEVGGAFGGKETPVVEPRLLAVAKQTDRPVRLAASREQEFTTTPSRPEFRIRIKDGVTTEGDLLARDVTMDIDVGGYDVEVFNIATAVPTSILGCYDADAVSRTTNAVYTNRPPFGAFRGFGLPEANFAAERHMDRVAKRLGLDPLEYRAQNLLRAGDENANGEVLRPVQSDAVLRSSQEALASVDLASEYP
jgi:CO/xanthine dehydrogenase Mo-binding subunit